MLTLEELFILNFTSIFWPDFLISKPMAVFLSNEIGKHGLLFTIRKYMGMLRIQSTEMKTLQ